MYDCKDNHCIGMRNEGWGELVPVYQSDYDENPERAMYSDDWFFNFCPECGLKLPTGYSDE